MLTGPGESFTLRHPASWERLPADRLRGRDARALAGIKRSDDRAVLTVQRRGRLGQRYGVLARDLTARLRRQVDGFRFVDAKTVRIPAGEALSYTFVRGTRDQVQNLTVLADGDRTWTLSSVVAGDEPQVAREAATIVRSFRPAD